MSQPDSDSPANSPPGASVRLSRVLAVGLGNGLEFYDFLAYTLFAVYIGRAFFPTRSGSLSLLLSVGTFGIGFVTRPLGALVLGRFGDRAGRKPAMLLSFLLMGVGMLMLAATPSFATIGLAAPVLVVLSRLIQGFALGGDIGPTTAYMIEAAPVMRRGLYGSVQFTSQQAAALSAALVGLALAQLLSPTALASWGWRVAFLLGASIVPLGVLLRSRLPETFPARRAAAAGAEGRPPLRPYALVIGCTLLLLATSAISAYVLNYLASYALATLHMAASRAFSISLVASLCQVVMLPLSGWLSDRFGRRPIIRTGYLLTLLLVAPAFALISRHPPAPLLYATVGLLATCSAFGRAPIIVSLTEALPSAVRSGVVAITDALAVAIFGGTAQLAVTWLIQRTGSALAPAWYWMAALLLGLIAAVYIPETAPARIRRAVAMTERSAEAVLERSEP